MFTHKKYPAKFKPYVITEVDYNSIIQHDPFWGLSIDVLIIPVVRQNLTPGCPNVTSIQHYFDDGWALRVGYNGDEHAGHIGTAFAPFICERPGLKDESNRYLLTTKSGKQVEVGCGLVHPVKREDGLWYWRVELNRRLIIN